MNANLIKWLFRPFEFISEQKALWIGIVSILLAGSLNSITHSHFDGVVDFHGSRGENYSLVAYLSEGFINWIIFGGLLYIAGLIFSSSSIRFIDVMGMQAFARWPFLLMSIFTLILPHAEVYKYLDKLILKESNEIIVPFYQWILFILHGLIAITILVWTIILMYRAYSLSCNIKAVKGIISFIVALIIAEIIVKSLLFISKSLFAIL